MNLKEGYIARLQELAGLINEDRIDKLIAQKYPQEIIDFVKDFAIATTKDRESIPAIRQNHYIPWIAAQAKNNPSIMKDKDKIDTIISWIKNTGYNKINNNVPFDDVFNKASEWLRLNNKDTQTGERLDGGKVIIEYPNGYKWIRATEVNWCINAGEANGWCFNQQSRAETFVGVSDVNPNKAGYFLLDEKNNPKIALQYDQNKNIIDDVQGTHNTPVSVSLFPMLFDLIKKFPVVIDVTGHQNSFWESFKQHGAGGWINQFLELPNVNISVESKLKNNLPLSKEDINSLTVQQKLERGFALTPKEIDSLSLEQKTAYGYLSNTEKNLLPIQLKIEYDILLNTRDLKILNQPLKDKIRKVANGMKSFKDLFILENNPVNEKNSQLPIKNNFEGFSDYIIDDDAVHLKMEEEEYDEYYSGFDEYQQHFKYVDTSDYYYDDWEEEEKYMSNYLSEDNMNKIKEIAKSLGIIHNYNFDEEGEVKRFIENNLSNASNILENYMIDLDHGMTSARKIEIDQALSEIKFNYNDGYLDLPWKDLWEFLKDKEIEKFSDLKDMNINGEVELENSYYGGHDISKKDLDDLNNTFARKLDEAELTVIEHPDYVTNVQKFNQIINDLKFEGGNFIIYAPTNQGSAIYKKELPTRDIYIEKLDYVNQKAYVFIVDFRGKNKKTISKRQKGWIHFDSIVNYIQQHTLFKEAEIRKAIQKILAEDFRYEYNRTSGFVPPIEVINTAQRALNAVEANKLVQSSGSNEGSGLQKAKSLIAKEPVTHAQLKRMKAFFDNNASLMARERAANRNVNNSAIIQSWELWGGDAGRTWVEREIRKTQSSNQTSKEIRNSDMIARDNRIMSTTNTRINR